MATLVPPVRLKSGASYDLAGQVLIWWDIGTAQVSTASEYSLALSASYQVGLVGEGFTLAIELTDKDPTSTSGPCTVFTGGNTIVGTYQQSGTSFSFKYGDPSAPSTGSLWTDAGGVYLNFGLATLGFPTLFYVRF